MSAIEKVLHEFTEFDYYDKRKDELAKQAVAELASLSEYARSQAARDKALESMREALKNLLSKHGFYYGGEDEILCECEECQKARAALAALEEVK